MYVVCEQHLERALDDFVEVYGSPPDLYLLDKVSFTDWISPASCDFCHLPPKYLVV